MVGQGSANAESITKTTLHSEWQAQHTFHSINNLLVLLLLFHKHHQHQHSSSKPTSYSHPLSPIETLVITSTMGIAAQEKAEKYSDLSELCDGSGRAYDNLGAFPSRTSLRRLRDQYDDIAGHYLIDSVVSKPLPPLFQLIRWLICLHVDRGS